MIVTVWVGGRGQCVDVSATYCHVSAGTATVQSVATYDRRCRHVVRRQQLGMLVVADIVVWMCGCGQGVRIISSGTSRTRSEHGGRLVPLDVSVERHSMRTMRLLLGRRTHQLHTSNLSKAHVTRDSSGPATLAISVGLQQ